MAAVTNITLDQIWALTNEQVDSILKSQNVQPTGNSNYDRAVLSILYFNSGQLDKAYLLTITFPHYTLLMGEEKDLSSGLSNLHKAFMAKLLTIDGIFSAIAVVASMAIDVKTDADRTLLRAVFDNIINISVTDIRFGTNSLLGYIQEMTRVDSNVYIPDTEDIYPSLVEVKESHEQGEAEDFFSIIADIAVVIVGDALKHSIEDVLRNSLNEPNATVKWRAEAIVSRALRDVIPFIPAVQTAIFDRIKTNRTIPGDVLDTLMSANLPSPPTMVSGDILRCLYVALVWDAAQSLPPTLSKHLDKFIKKQGCTELFVPVPLTIDKGLSPLLGEMGKAGGAEALKGLIGTYASREPTFNEVLGRLLASQTH